MDPMWKVVLSVERMTHLIFHIIKHGVGIDHFHEMLIHPRFRTECTHRRRLILQKLFKQVEH